MKSSFVFMKTIIDWDKMVSFWGNEFYYVSETEYHDSKGKLPDGVVVTLRIIKDDGDYGVSKKTGKPFQNNLGQNFDVTILNGKTSTDFKYEDKVTLIGFDQENSYAVNFDLLLRFKDIKKVQPVAQPLMKGV